jgi:hypothetical protein
MATRNQVLATEVQNLTQANNNMSQLVAALQQQVQQLLQAQQQPPVSLLAPMPPDPPVAAPTVPPVNPAITAVHQRAQTNTGIVGYENKRPLTAEEQAYVTQMLGLGINKAAAHELFQHGYNKNKKWKKIKATSINNLVTNVSKNKSPYCLKTDRVFYGHSFGDKICVVIQKYKV